MFIKIFVLKFKKKFLMYIFKICITFNVSGHDLLKLYADDICIIFRSSRGYCAPFYTAAEEKDCKCYNDDVTIHNLEYVKSVYKIQTSY